MVKKKNKKETKQMKETATSYLVRVADRGVVTLPAAIRRATDIEKGDFLELVVEEGEIRALPKKLVDKDQAYFWNREWQEGEREAEEDIDEGRVKEFDSVDELLEELSS